MRFSKILEVLRKHQIGYFFLIGGNDTMDTFIASRPTAQQGYPLVGVACRKRLTNDLFGTHHTPDSAARPLRGDVREAGRPLGPRHAARSTST